MEDVGENKYMRLQCNQMEKFYNNDKVPPIYRDIMRANNFRVKSLSKAVAFDKENKHCNLPLKCTPVTMSLDVSIMRSRHVTIADKAAKEMWGVPKRWCIIRGTSLQNDILELEGVMHLCLIFVSHKSSPMHKDYFWNIVCPKTNVGFIRDCDKTTIPHTEHKHGLICRIIRGQVNNDKQDSDNDNHDKDDVSKMSNDNNSEVNFIHAIDDDDFDGDVTNEECAARLEITCKKLGNMSRKPVDRHATTNLFATGHVYLQKGLPKAHNAALRKQQHKQELIFSSMKYFSAQMDQRKTKLDNFAKRLSDQSTVHHQMMWRINNKQHMKTSQNLIDIYSLINDSSSQ